MNTETTSTTESAAGGDPASGSGPVVLVLAVTVLAFVAIVVLALTGHALTAGVIGTVWAATCGVLGYKRP
ncbi:MAG TPA: hypothetical protein VGL36_35685 [Kribbella sp.]